MWNVLDDLYHSDHFPIEITSYLPSTTSTSPVRWNFKKADWTKFSTDVKFPMLTNNVDIDVQNISQAILTSAKNCIPLTSGKHKQRSVPWWNEQIKQAIQDKKRAFNFYKKHPTLENQIIFKKLSANAKYQILEAKRLSWASYVSSINSNTSSRVVWQKIRAMSGRKSSFLIHKLVKNSQNITTVQGIVQELGDQFASASSSSNYSLHFQNLKTELEVPLDFSSNISQSYNHPFSLNELESVLHSLKDSSPGHDNITYSMIQHLPPEALRLLLTLYNTIWSTGVYPQVWRQAIVIPLLKQNKDPLLSSSYRPISLTCCLSKVLEKMINRRLVWYLETNSLLRSYQSGFRKYHSTLDQLVKLENDVQNAFLNNSHLTAIFFDLEKAYDMTWHHGILQRLHQWGLRGNLPIFFLHFLKIVPSVSVSQILYQMFSPLRMVYLRGQL